MHGRGRRILSDGNFYEGEFVCGKACGYGRCMANDDFMYEGYWKADFYHGKGKLVYSSGVYKEGDFVLGKLTGKGIQMWADGTKYIGEF
jgi:hypothetical protein